MPDSKSVRLRIAGITLGVVSKGHNWELPGVYQSFVTHNSESPVQVLTIGDGNIPSLKLERRIFKAERSGWTLHQDAQGQFIFDFPRSISGGYTRRLAVFSPSFESAQIYVQPDQDRSADSADLFPLEYPLHRLVMTNFLTQGHGVMLHAAAVIERGEALVFAGHSGTGKSTLARLYGGEDGVTVLNDDAIIVRKIEGQYWAFGTPWSSSMSVCSPLGAPIGRIFAIEHAKENVARPVGKRDAVAMLFAHALLPLYRPEGLQFPLDFLSELGQRVACHKLGFVPDAAIISFVRRMRRG